MTLMKFQGKAKYVFKIFNAIAQRYPELTLGELNERGLKAG